MRGKPHGLVWPSLLELPAPDVALVYLDLNHWISLAQASLDQSQGRSFVEALAACRAARSAGAAKFVLAAAHYMEMNKIKNPAQRREVASVMEELTGFASLVSRVAVVELELDAVLDQFASTPSGLRTIPLLGRGVRHAFGLESGVRFISDSGDATREVREQMGPEAFDNLVARANLLLERSVLRGPAEDEVDELRANGWKPEASVQIAEMRATEERELKYKLDTESRWRRGRLRDVVSVRELCIELKDVLPRTLKQRGLEFSKICPDPESSRRFVCAMPSTEVSIELKTAWHRNGSKVWTANDIYDIDALSLAVPYCDVVVTDKACHHALDLAGFGERMQTALLRRLEDLPATL